MPQRVNRRCIVRRYTKAIPGLNEVYVDYPSHRAAPIRLQVYEAVSADTMALRAKRGDMRFEGEAIDGATTLCCTRDRATGRSVVLERGVRSDRLRQIQSLPRCAEIAPFERTREGHRLQLVHPAPLELVPPVDDFDVAQAVGSLLDGLAWMHAHDVTHGAVGPIALTAGPTGGRLSLAGASSAPAPASPADDVFAAAVLAFTLLLGEPPGAEGAADSRLAQRASPAVVEAIRDGLDPIAERRPSAAALAAMVRGERLLPLWDVTSRDPLLGRLRSAMANAARAFEGRWTTVAGAAAALVLIFGGLAAAQRNDSTKFAAVTPLVEFLPPAPGATRADAAPTTLAAATTRPSTTVAVAPNTTAVTNPQAEASVLSNSETAPNTGGPATTPPTTRPATPPPTAAPTTAPPAPTTTRTPTTTTTTRPAPTTTRAATTTTTTRPATPTKSGKGKGNNADSLLGTLIDAILGEG